MKWSGYRLTSPKLSQSDFPRAALWLVGGVDCSVEGRGPKVQGGTLTLRRGADAVKRGELNVLRDQKRGSVHEKTVIAGQESYPATLNVLEGLCNFWFAIDFLLIRTADQGWNELYFGAVLIRFRFQFLACAGWSSRMLAPQ